MLFTAGSSFSLAGKLITLNLGRGPPPGDRPVAEYLRLLEHTGFRVEQRGGIFPTVPIAFRAVNHQPKQRCWLVGVLDVLLTPGPRVPHHAERAETLGLIYST